MPKTTNNRHVQKLREIDRQIAEKLGLDAVSESEIPTYTDDIAKAFELPLNDIKGHSPSLSLTGHRKQWCSYIYDEAIRTNHGRFFTDTKTALTPALALCLAWLSWREALGQS